MQEKFLVFLDVVKDLGLTGNNFSDAISVIQEHCLNKGITDYSTIKETWNKHQYSIQEVVKHIKEHTDEHF